MSALLPVKIHECASPDGSLRRGCHCHGHTDEAGALTLVATGDYRWHAGAGVPRRKTLVSMKNGILSSNGSAPIGVRAIAPTESQHSNRVVPIVDNSNRVDPEYWNTVLAREGLSTGQGKFLIEAPRGKGLIETGGYSSKKVSEILAKKEERADGYKVAPSGTAPIGDEKEDVRTGNYDEDRFEPDASWFNTAVGVVKVLELYCTVCGESEVRRMFLPDVLGRGSVEKKLICRKCFTPRKRDHYEFGWLNPENDFVWNEKMEALVQVPQSEHRTPNMMTPAEAWAESKSYINTQHTRRKK